MADKLTFEKIAGILPMLAPFAIGGSALMGGKHLTSYFGKKKGDKSYAMERPFDYKFSDKPWLGQLDAGTDTVIHNPGDWTSFRALMSTYTPEERRALKDEGLLRYHHVWNPGDYDPEGSGLPQADFPDSRDPDNGYKPWENRVREPDSHTRARDKIIEATERAAAKKGLRG